MKLSSILLFLVLGATTIWFGCGTQRQSDVVNGTNLSSDSKTVQSNAPLSIMPMEGELYNIVPDGGTNLCMDIRLSGDDKGNLQIWTCSGGNNQKFWVRYDPSAQGYEIAMDHHTDDYCLDVYGSGNGSGNRVHEFRCNGKPNQRWKIVEAGGGWFEIQPMHVTGMCLDIEAEHFGQGSPVNQFTCNGHGNQHWKFNHTTHKPDEPGPPPPTPIERPAESWLRDATAGNCTPISQFLYQNCKVLAFNENPNRTIEAQVCWHNTGIPPGPFFDKCVPLQDGGTVVFPPKSKWLLPGNVIPSLNFPIATNPSQEFFVKSGTAKYK